MKEFNHEGGRVVYQRNKLKSLSLLCKRFSIVYFLGGAVFGKVSLQHEAYEACFAGLLLSLLFWVASKTVDWYIASYERRQDAIVGNIWQE